MYIIKFIAKNIYVYYLKEGIFLPKSICIKTNNKQNISYIINELDNLKIDNVYFSCKKFKNFVNIIVHYKGRAPFFFITSLSKILTYLVLDIYENLLIKKIIEMEYFYFSLPEQNSIYSICIDTLNFESSLDRFEVIQTSFYNYLIDNKSINLKGFIDFRLFEYVKYLDNIVDICVNKFIIDKEYLEFVNLLKGYVFSSKSNIEIAHLVYKNRESFLLDANKNIIPINKNAFDRHFISDISFSSNDYTLNKLLTLLPNNLFVHLIDKKDEFINTLELIFGKRLRICNGCDICKLYKNANLRKDFFNL